MRSFFASSDVSFVLVSTPTPEALEEAYYFEDKTRELSLPLGGYVLNRSLAWAAGRPLPSVELLPEGASEPARRAVAKLAALATSEAESAARHQRLRAELAKRVAAGFALALPELPAGVSNLEGLVALAERLVVAPSDETSGDRRRDASAQ